MSDTPINTKISPVLDPETYRAAGEGYDDATRSFVGDVVSFMNDAYVTLGKLHVAKDLADSNPAWTEANRILIVGAEATKQKERLARKLDRVSQDLDMRISGTEAELLKPVQQGAAAGPLAAEVRNHFKSLDSGERSRLIREALEADDESTLQAVLGAQPFLSNMTAADRDYFISLYHSKKSPHLVSRLELMKRVRELMDSNGANGAAFHRSFEKVVGAKPNMVSAIEKANRLALDALKIEPTA